MVVDPIEIDPRTLLESHCSLPSLPACAIRIPEMVQNDDVDLEVLSELIRGEPALVASILEVVDSA